MLNYIRTKKHKIITRLAKTAFALVNYGCAFHCVTEHIVRPLICSGPSMEPTLETNNLVFCECISRKLHRYNYGDIIVFRSLNDRAILVCKRITGLPGDRIYFRDQRSVPSGHLWVEGDNRDESLDSRNYGPVPQGLIVGRVVCKLWPLKDMTMLTVKSK